MSGPLRRRSENHPDRRKYAVTADGLSAPPRPFLEPEGGADLSLPFARVAILGVGLMGGSLGLALRARGLAQTVVGWDRREEALTSARRRGAIDCAETDLNQAVREADAIFLAVPVGVAPELLERIAPQVHPDTLLSDLGSVKTAVVAAGHRLFGAQFVGGHPMAGSERSGVEAASAALFVDAAWAVVPAQLPSAETPSAWRACSRWSWPSKPARCSSTPRPTTASSPSSAICPMGLLSRCTPPCRRIRNRRWRGSWRAAATAI